jgi:hypothetical protein
VSRAFVCASLFFAVSASACGAFLGFSDDDEPPPSVATVGDASSPIDASASDGAVAIDAGSTPIVTCDGGPCERFVFITSAVYGGNLGGIAGANAKCMERAASAGATLANRTFVALLSGSAGITGNAIDRAGNGPPFRRVDGVLVSEGGSLFNDAGTLLAPLNRDEHGVERDDVSVWTGTDAFGSVTDQGVHCSDWTSAESSIQGSTGTANAAGIMDGTWLYNNSEACNLQRRIYCVQQ